MWVLLIPGALLGEGGSVLNEIRSVPDTGPFCAALFLVFIGCSAIRVLNTLSGSAVAAREEEAMLATMVKGRMLGIMDSIDQDGNRLLSKEFGELLAIPEAVATRSQERAGRQQVS